MGRADSLEKTLMLGKTEDARGEGVAEDKMAGWHHQLNGPEFEHTLGYSEGQGSLACCSPWGHRVGGDLVIITTLCGIEERKRTVFCAEKTSLEEK